VNAFPLIRVHEEMPSHEIIHLSFFPLGISGGLTAGSCALAQCQNGTAPGCPGGHLLALAVQSACGLPMHFKLVRGPLSLNPWPRGKGSELVRGREHFPISELVVLLFFIGYEMGPLTDCRLSIRG
jgi:hypothetical protein